jgi:hypothetical protein
MMQVSQAQTSGPQFYRTAVMDGNNIKTVFGNWGVISQPANLGHRGAWINASNGYIGDESFFVGIELPINDYNNDGVPDTVHSVIACPVDRPQQMPRDEGPMGDQWSFMPESTSINLNSQSVAMSDDPTTWPSSWNGAWNGLFVTGKINATLESFYRVNDEQDKRFNAAPNNQFGYVYHPDTTSLSRTGQGIQVDVRYLQFNHLFGRDILFRVYDITNTSDYRYDKMVFGDLMGTYVGVTSTESYSEWDDDYTVLLKDRSVAITGDYDNNCARDPLWKGPVGKFGNAFITSPGDTIASYDYFTPANNVSFGDDEGLWQKLKPGRYRTPSSVTNDTVVTRGEDGDYTIGTEYFPLNSRETKRIVSVLVYGYSNTEIQQKLLLAKILYNNNLDTSQFGKIVSLKNLTVHSTISNTKEIQWESTQSGGTVNILFSSDFGRHLSVVASDVPNSGSFQWNTTTISDCPFGMIYLILKNSSGNPVDAIYSSSFTINNFGNGSPVLFIPDGTSPFLDSAKIVDNSITINMYIADPESSNVTMTLYYNVGNGFIKHDSQLVQSKFELQPITINLEPLPNSLKMLLRLEVSDGNTSSSITTGVFSKQNIRMQFPPSKVSYILKNTTYEFDVNIVDPSKITQDKYVISFNDTTLNVPRTFSVFNKSKNSYMIVDEPLPYKTETSIFDGIALQCNDLGSSFGAARWSRTDLQNMKIQLRSYTYDVNNDGKPDLWFYPHACDYRMIFYSTVVDTTVPAWAIFGFPQSFLKYKIFNSLNDRVKVVIDEQLATIHNIGFYELVAGQWRSTWNLIITGTGIPILGDTLYISTLKGISVYDSLLINLSLGVQDDSPSIPSAFELFQNYPNPFNPATKIRYQLPINCIVSLKIYDLIGREITTLVNEEQGAGRMEVEWNANVASGLYFYRIHATSLNNPNQQFIETKKMLLLR